jgi:hypothetical protein
MNEVRLQWNQIYTESIIISSGKKSDTQSFVGDQFIVAGSEDSLQREYSHYKI